MQSKAKNGFIKGAAIIAAANILVKVIGAVFKIPLDRFILQTDGMALYTSAYTIYNLLFVISTAGLPVAISKMVAESTSRGNYKEADVIFKMSMKLLLCLGLAGTLILGFGSKLIAEYGVHFPDAYLTMIAMSPSLLLVGGMSAYRGYFQGMQNMLPTAVSEVCEALGKLVVGLLLAYILLPKGKMYASAGAISGVTFGSLIGFLFLTAYYFATRRKMPHDDGGCAVRPKKVLWRKLIYIAIPITIGVAVFTLTSLIDASMVSRQMIHYIDGDVMRSAAQANLTAPQWAKFLEFTDPQKKVEFIYGYLTRAITMFNLPPTVIAAISISVVPAIAAAISQKNRQQAQRFTKSALRITILLALPCAVGMSVLARPILSLVYGDGSYSSLLNIMGLSVALVTLVQIANAVLQAWGKVWIPVVSMLIGGIVKVVVNYTLVGIPSININGAPVGTFLCYFTVVSLNFYYIVKYTGVHFEMGDFFVKPILSVSIMSLGASFAYKTLYGIVSNQILATGGAIVFAGVLYFVVLFAIKGIKEEDVKLLPKGERIFDLLCKMHLMKKQSKRLR